MTTDRQVPEYVVRIQGTFDATLRAVETGPRCRIGITPRRIDRQAAARWLAVGLVIALLRDDFCSHEARGDGMTVW